MARVTGRYERTAVAGEEVVLEALDPLKPATLRAVDQTDFMYLLMPVRIS